MVKTPIGSLDAAETVGVTEARWLANASVDSRLNQPMRVKAAIHRGYEAVTSKGVQTSTSFWYSNVCLKPAVLVFFSVVNRLQGWHAHL